MTTAALRLVASGVQTSAHRQPPSHHSFSVTVRTLDKQRLRFNAIGRTSADVHAAQLDRFGGLCSVVVIPSEAAHGN